MKLNYIAVPTDWDAMVMIKKELDLQNDPDHHQNQIICFQWSTFPKNFFKIHP